MQIKLEKNSSLAIRPDAGWSRIDSWLLWPNDAPNDANAWRAWTEEVRLWQPLPGSPWRISAPEIAAGWEVDPEWITLRSEAQPLDDAGWRVICHGAPCRWEPELIGGLTREIGLDGETSCAAVWRVPQAALGDWLPVIEAPLEWAGRNCRCTGIKMRELPEEGFWEVTIAARDQVLKPEGEIQFRRNCDFESVKSGKWRVTAEQLENFRRDNEINQLAAWAGDGYYITDFAVQPAERGTFEVAVEAKHVNVRLLEVRRFENFVGFSRRGRPRRRVHWTSRWRVHRDSIRKFENITGNSAYSWTRSNSVITEVSPNRLSDWEYEYTIQAIPRNSNMYQVVDPDDRSELAGRVDLRIAMSDFFITAAQAGWNRKPGGEWVALADWKPLTDCPLHTMAPLPQKMADNSVKTILALETSYQRMSHTGLIALLESWTGQSRIWTGSVGGFSAAWLKEDVTTDAVLDDSGDVWQKITRIYRKAPAGWDWNPEYWRNK